MTTGDKIIPREISYEFKLMFEDRTLKVMAYNIETVLAEKIETILSRGTANTRMRDFYDVYIIMTMYKDIVNFKLLRSALVSVSQNRNTYDVIADKTIILKEITSSDELRFL